MKRFVGTTLIILISLLYTLVPILLESCSDSHDGKKESVSSSESASEYVGSAKCQSCHVEQFNDWKKSDHYLAMQEAWDSTVLGDFNDVVYEADGVSSRFFKIDGKFFINTEGDDGKNHDFQVQYTFGYYPLQQYLIAFPDGRFQATRLSWDSKNNKWFHQYAGDQIHHKDWLHWTGNGQNWNTMCASCHSTDLKKNYEFSKDAYTTTWKDINVGCESCHGPGSRHIQLVNAGNSNSSSQVLNSGFIYGNDSIPQQQLNSCAPCHARKTDLTEARLNTGEILDDLIPQIISNDYYHADGQINEEDYEYGSFAQSKMFHSGVHCSSCHNPHSGKLKLTGNSLCMSCHKPEYNTTEHHFHTVNTEGAQCISCHMHQKAFMGIDMRRDHSFRVPRPDQSAIYGTPNSCNSCHTEKNSKWAADAITKWYGPTRMYHFSDDLLPGSLLNIKSEFHLIKLLRDTIQPEIARATAANYLGQIQTQKSLDALLVSMNDRKSLVRYHSVRSLENFPSEAWQQNAYSALSDKVRAVRIAAADLYHRLPPDAIPSDARGAYLAADAENLNYLHYQTDFSVGNVMLADYHLQNRDYVNAITHYLRGLKKDSLMNYARFNLSASLSSVGKNQEALKVLNEAAMIDPGNERIFYNRGLLYYELGDRSASMNDFRKSLKLGSTNPGLYYNYGLLLQQDGKLKEAESIFLKGYSLDPQALNINYALTFLYLSQNNKQSARKYAETLRRGDPNNPDYQPMFRTLGISN